LKKTCRQHPQPPRQPLPSFAGALRRDLPRRAHEHEAARLVRRADQLGHRSIAGLASSHGHSPPFQSTTLVLRPYLREALPNTPGGFAPAPPPQPERPTSITLRNDGSCR